MVRALDEADAMLTLSSASLNTILPDILILRNC